MHSICLIPGDGVGQEVVRATESILLATGLAFDMHYAEAGWACFEKTGSSVPDETLQAIREADATLAGAFTSPKHHVAGFHSAIRTMRTELKLFANVRPAISVPLADSFTDVDMLMVRENSEGLYAGKERRYGDTALAEAVVTRAASERITRLALEQARQRRKKLAVIHKANVLPMTSGFFLQTALETAEDYPDIEVTDIIVDAAAMHLVRQPERFDVLVTTNLFGDILSDLMAGLVGGLGLAPSANIGTDCAIFEPVHGSAPDIAGRGIANPIATVLSAAMMLDYLSESRAARRLRKAVTQTLKGNVLTPDLGGKATTAELSDVLITHLERS